MVSSPNGWPSNCKPMGSFGFFVNPHGTLTPQMPARLQEIVKMSDKYICNGSSDFSPILNAAVGEVGVTMASTASNDLSTRLREQSEVKAVEPRSEEHTTELQSLRHLV